MNIDGDIDSLGSHVGIGAPTRVELASVQVAYLAKVSINCVSLCKSITSTRVR